MKKYVVLALMCFCLISHAEGEATYYWNNGCGSSCAEDSCGAPYDTSCGATCYNKCPCEFDIGVDFLWWKPCVEDLEICGHRKVESSEVLGSPITYKFDYHGICPEWEPGFRVWFNFPDLFSWCHLGFEASYTNIDFKNSSHHNGDAIPLLLHPGFVEELDFNPTGCNGTYEACYQEGEALLYFDWCNNGCNTLRPYFGLAGVYLDQELKSDSTYVLGTAPTGSARTKWESELWGVGLRVGAEYRFCYAKCLNFYAFADGTFLGTHSESEDKQEFFNGIQNEILKTKDDHCWSCLPGFHLGVGAEWNFCICDFDMGIRLGYEFLEWFGVPKHRVFTGDDLENEIGSSSHEDRSFGFQGLFAGLVFHF